MFIVAPEQFHAENRSFCCVRFPNNNKIFYYNFAVFNVSRPAMNVGMWVNARQCVRETCECIAFTSHQPNVRLYNFDFRILHRQEINTGRKHSTHFQRMPNAPTTMYSFLCVSVRESVSARWNNQFPLNRKWFRMHLHITKYFICKLRWANTVRCASTYLPSAAFIYVCKFGATSFISRFEFVANKWTEKTGKFYVIVISYHTWHFCRTLNVHRCHECWI